MTPFRHFTQFPVVKNVIRKGSLYVVVSGLLFFYSCSSGTNPEEETVYETVAVDKITKGVYTIIEEVEKDKFKIAEEKEMPTAEESKIIIKYMTGRIDSMSLDSAQALVSKANFDRTSYNPLDVPQPDSTDISNNGNNLNHQNTHNIRQNHTINALGNVLFWGGVGYFLGRSFMSPSYPQLYRHRDMYQYSVMNKDNWKNSVRTMNEKRPIYNFDKEKYTSNNNSGGSGYRPSTGGSSYRPSTGGSSSSKSGGSSTSSSRPSGGRSGFFSGGGSSSS